MATAEESKLAQLLARTHALFGVSVHDLESLVRGREALTFRARQVIYLPGDRSNGVHFLTSGRVKISKVSRDGKELTLAYRSANDFFGDACLLDGGPRTEMAEAMEPSVTIEVPREPLLALIQKNAAVAAKFAFVVLSRQRELESKLEQFVFKDVGAKLAELLLKLGAEHGMVHRDGLALGLNITHQEMANLIGSTRETVSLTLSEFKRKGYIATEGRRVILSNRDGLRALA